MATILIVEGQAAGRSALAGVLRSANHRVAEAGDGADVLTQAQAQHFDLVMSDINLPGMDGCELVRRLRADPDLAGTPVILVAAACDQPETRARAQACGADKVLFRPAEPAKILQTAAEVLSGPDSAVARPDAERDDTPMRSVAERAGEKMGETEGWLAGHPVRPILVVEDNPMDLDFMLQAFAENNVGNPVRVCRDGEEALQFIEGHHAPDDPELPLLVLLDLRLPKVDGIDVLREARKLPVWEQIPFVVITTSREDSDISRAYKLGVNSYIVKPVDFAAFAEVVKHIKVFWLLTNVPPFPEIGRL